MAMYVDLSQAPARTYCLSALSPLITEYYWSCWYFPFEGIDNAPLQVSTIKIERSLVELQTSHKRYSSQNRKCYKPGEISYLKKIKEEVAFIFILVFLYHIVVPLAV